MRIELHPFRAKEPCDPSHRKAQVRLLNADQANVPDRVPRPDSIINPRPCIKVADRVTTLKL